MKNGKKIWAVMLSAAMLFSLAACSSGKEEAAERKPAAEGENTQEAAKEAVDEKAQEPVSEETAEKAGGMKIGYISPGADTRKRRERNQGRLTPTGTPSRNRPTLII